MATDSFTQSDTTDMFEDCTCNRDVIIDLAEHAETCPCATHGAHVGGNVHADLFIDEDELQFVVFGVHHITMGIALCEQLGQDLTAPDVLVSAAMDALHDLRNGTRFITRPTAQTLCEIMRRFDGQLRTITGESEEKYKADLIWHAMQEYGLTEAVQVALDTYTEVNGPDVNTAAVMQLRTELNARSLAQAFSRKETLNGGL
jgi:hypothetical protein